MEKFVFSNVYQILKRYTNKHCSDLEFIYFLFGKVNKDKDDQNTELRINKSQASRIINGIDDVPKRVRDYYSDSKNAYQLNLLFQEYLDERFEEGQEDEITEELRELYLDDESLSETVKANLERLVDDDFYVYFSEVFKESLKISNKKCHSIVCLYSKGKTTINYLEDDLLKISFNDKYIQGEKIVVIPTNTAFDTKVTKPNDVKQRVSNLSLHGKWLLKMNEKGITSEQLDCLIKESLSLNYGSSEGINDFGRVAVIKYKHVYFYLLSITSFDGDGIAHSSKALFEETIDKLLSFYNKNGQGYSIYLPLMGTGMSRLNMTYEESFELIKRKTLNQASQLCGTINIVGYTKDSVRIGGENGVQK